MSLTHCDKSTSHIQLTDKHCKLQVKLSSIALFCSTRASALTYMDYFDINYSLTEPNVLFKCTCITTLESNVWHYLHVCEFMSRCLCFCVKQELKTCVCVKSLRKCVPVCLQVDGFKSSGKYEKCM